jgi:hypothetical protein
MLAACFRVARADASLSSSFSTLTRTVGVILYIMLTGVHPFDIKGVSTDAEIEARIRKDPRPPLDEDIVGHLSKSAIDLITKLMEKDPRKRMSAYQMLQHPWVRGETALTEKMQDSDKKLSRFKDTRDRLEASMFAVLVSQSHGDARLSEAKVKEKKVDGDAAIHVLQRAFAVFDAEGKGFVTPDDLGRVANERTGSNLTTQDTREFLETTDGGGGQPLSLSQFNKLFSGLHQKHYPRGHYIFHAGEHGDAMYFINSGKVEIQTRKGQLVSILRSGDFFGEGSLLNKEATRFTTAKCSTPVDVIEIKRADFDRYLGVSKSVRSDLTLKWRVRTLNYAKNLLRLQKNVTLTTFKKGEVVYNEGDLGNAMYRVDDDNGGESRSMHTCGCCCEISNPSPWLIIRRTDGVSWRSSGAQVHWRRFVWRVEPLVQSTAIVDRDVFVRRVSLVQDGRRRLFGTARVQSGDEVVTLEHVSQAHFQKGGQAVLARQQSGVFGQGHCCRLSRSGF